eukprot:TRINITY_DN17094_c0_g1_i1.p1 TRINITY_DN17094_c0_g1~~TRINITY_DN17094_c0_g1_i1.p1  ORF type:complete len:296 (-),score=33.26 TRINITY_DN17094_c0_g1_i1:104-928(-)
MSGPPKRWWHHVFCRDSMLTSTASLVAALLLARSATKCLLPLLLPQSPSLDAEVSKARALVAALTLKPAFSKRVLELAAFKDRVGHADVPLESATGNNLVPKGLGRWVYAQRKRKAEGHMTKDEEAALTALEIRWKLDPEELDCDEMLERLTAYKAANGDTLVPKKYEQDPLLGAWVAAMRRKADPLLNGGQSALSPELRQRLDDAGFSWKPARVCGSSFMTGFRQWSEAKMAGQPVPDENWCHLQREARKQGKLSEQRIAYLDKFDFDWQVHS